MIHKNKIAIVTGGSRGIGRAIAQQFITDDYTVIICARNAAEVSEATKALDKSGKRAVGMIIDISKVRDCRKLITTTYQKFGRIDVLVNNAGIYGPIGPLHHNNIGEWKKTITINLLGTVTCTRYVIPIMRKQKSGKIINIAGAGVGGSKSLERFSSYYTSKFAVVGFTEVIAAELLEENVQVNCISPGGVNTYFTDYLLSQGIKKAGKQAYEQALKQKRHGANSLTSIIRLVSYLTSPAADHITGRILSAKWDSHTSLQKLKPLDKNLYRLRRIDHKLFYEAEKD